MPGLALRAKQVTIEEEGKIIIADRCQDEGVYRLIEPGEQTAGEAERFVRKGRVIADREIEPRHSGDDDGDVAIHDFDGIGRDAHLRIEEGVAGSNVVFPLVPRAAENAPFQSVPIFVDI